MDNMNEKHHVLVAKKQRHTGFGVPLYDFGFSFIWDGNANKVQKNFCFCTSGVDTVSAAWYNAIVDTVSTIACKDAERRRNV